MLKGLGRDVEGGLERPSQSLFCEFHFLFAEGRAVGFKGVLFMGRAIAEVGPHHDDGRPFGIFPGGTKGLLDCTQVVAVIDRLDVPAVGLEPFRAVLSKGEICACGKGDMIVVIKTDELPELEMSGKRGGFVGDAFHQIAVTGKDIGEVVDDLETGTVVATGQIPFRHGQTHAVSETLAERSRRDFHPGRMSPLRMAGGMASPLPELSDLFERKVISRQVEEAIEEHRTMPSGQDKAVPVKPAGVRGVMFQKTSPQHISHGSSAERHSRMSAIGLLNGVDRQEADRIYAEFVQLIR